MEHDGSSEHRAWRDLRPSSDATSAAQRREGVSFGPFTCFPAERLLIKGDTAVKLGSRAFAILVLLLEKPGAKVSRRTLLERVWPDTSVEEGNLTLQIAALRKALGDGNDGARYIKTIARRGYCFIAPVTQSSVAEPDADDHTGILPPRLPHVIGRDDDVRAIGNQLRTSRFVTILGPGGVGKTTVAIEVGHELIEPFAGAVNFVDLTPTSDPRLVPSAVASALGLLVQSSDPTASLLSYVQSRRLLIVLDCCEHVVTTASSLLAEIFARAAEVHILVTSREKLRAEGETIYLLQPLAMPTSDPVPTAAEALRFPSVRLFVDRIQAGGTDYQLTDAEAPIAAEICRKLDGIALAIELAAGHVQTYGVRETARLLEDRFSLLRRGKRTAIPRHQSLRATLDWSYDLLPEAERALLRRLSIFAGTITLDAAQAVGGHDIPEPYDILDELTELVDKSLLNASTSLGQPRYRLLDITRAYAQEKLRESGEFAAISRLHARRIRAFLDRLSDTFASLSRAEAFRHHGEHLGNVRSALEWCFGPEGDVEIGTSLAAVASRLFLQLSLLTECRRWTEQALSVTEAAALDARSEMILLSSLGQALMFTRGNSEQVRTAFLRALTIAEQLADLPQQLQLLGSLHTFHERVAEFDAGFSIANRSLAVAEAHGDHGGIAAANSFLGLSHHLAGDHPAAHRHLLAAIVDAPIGAGIFFGFDHRNRARIALARNLFLQGHPDQAINAAHATVEHAATLDHAVTLCIALIWAVNVHFWTGDLEQAERAIERLTTHAERHSLRPYVSVGAGVKGELAIRRGETDLGITAVRLVMRTLHSERYELLNTQFLGAIAEGLTLAHRFDEALDAIEEVLALVGRQGDRFVMPDLLRIKAQVLLGRSDRIGSEAVLLQSLAMCRVHGALAWELRSATCLAALWTQDARPREARDLLAAVHGRFVEGFDTTDLRAARALLDTLA